VEHTLDTIARPSNVLKPVECSLPIGKTIIQGCADSCIQTISIICKLGPKAQLLPAWWYTAYYGKFPAEYSSIPHEHRCSCLEQSLARH
jgi:hypothetical protein